LPKPDGEWRCLVSPVDGEGNQSVWFIGTSPVQPTCRFLRVLLNDTSGMVEAIGDDRAQARHFPAKRRKGSLHIFALADAPLDAIVMEADFDYGRRLVRESLRLNESSPAPLPSAYRLFSDFLWGYDDAGMSAERHLPGLDPETAYELTPYTGSLLDHPAFAIWYSQDKSIYRQAVRLLCQHRNAFKRNSMAWFKQIVDDCFDSRAKVRYASQLEKMSEWLSLLGDDWAAEMALAASLTIQDTALENHPFLTRLVESSFRQAREDMQRGLGREW